MYTNFSVGCLDYHGNVIVGDFHEADNWRRAGAAVDCLKRLLKEQGFRDPRAKSPAADRPAAGPGWLARAGLPCHEHFGGLGRRRLKDKSLEDSDDLPEL